MKFAEWSTPECPFVVEYALGILDEVRIAVSDAFFSVPRGGAEIGGILLGKWETGRLTISGYKPLDCEHAYGPSFTLSPRDRAKLAELIASVRNSGEEVTGWYHSHTRSQIFLSEADREIHAEFFGEPWQVALVLKPHTFLPTRAGFFFREAAGTMRAESSCLEFTLEPLDLKRAPSPVIAPPSTSPANEVVEAPHDSSTSQPASALLLPPSSEPAATESLPSFLDVRLPTPRRWPKVVIPLVVIAAIGMAAYWERDLWIPRVMAVTQAAIHPIAPALEVGLITLDFDGQLQIRWNRNSPAVSQATNGVLHVKGGPPSAEGIPLDRDHLLSGVFTVARQSERVDVSLVLNRPDGPPIREVTSFIGQLPDSKSAPQENATSQTKQEDLASQVEKIRADLDDEIQRNRKLQKSFDFQTKQLHDQQRGRLLNQGPDKR
jgi:proteasome lid subunit RPN8/RPN11